MIEVVIVSAARTPIGAFGGALSSVSAVELGVTAAKAAIERAGIEAKQIDNVIIGNVLSAGLGQNIARQISIASGVSAQTPAMTINMVCGSGLRAVSLAAQCIKAGDAQIVLAGGSESMSNAPYVLPAMRWGSRMGDAQAIDTMLQDALTDAFENYHMGITAENLSKKYKISREKQDQFALESQQKTQKAVESGVFDEEIVPVVVKGRKGQVTVDKDEYPKANMTLEKLQSLKPAFSKEGTVTAGNASGINDGSAMLVVMSAQKAQELKLTPLARIVSYASAGVEPAEMGYGPVPATEDALARAGLRMQDMDLIEANEAFAAQALSVQQGLDLDMRKVNVNGGAIALGHPVGASGARILTSLLYQMKRQDAKTGLATLCIGGGMGTSLIVQR